jgi:endonuclease G, mitochondrial
MFDPDFLGVSVEVPTPVGVVADDVLEVGGTQRWDYAHFSLAMSASRRLARWVAWNVDGLRLFPSESIPRADDFRLDPRLPAATQTGEEVYAANDLDRGHLARRSDLCGAAWARRRPPTRTPSSSPTSPRR